MVAVLKTKNRRLFAAETLLCFVSAVIPAILRHHDMQVLDIAFAREFGFRLLLYTGILVLAVYLNDLYQIRVLSDKRALLPRLAKASVVAIVVYALIAAILPDAATGRVVFGSALLLCDFLFLLQYKLLGDYLANKAMRERVLVLGDGDLARTLHEELQSGIHHRQVLANTPKIEAAVLDCVRIVGADDPTVEEPRGEIRERIEGLRNVIDVMVLAFDGQTWPAAPALRAGQEEDARGLLTDAMEAGGRSTAGRTSAGRPDAARRTSTDFAVQRSVPTGCDVLRGIAGLEALGSGADYRQSDTCGTDTLMRGLVTLKLCGINVVGGLDYYERLTGRVFLSSPAGPLFFSQERFNIDKISLLIKDLWERLLAVIIFVIAIPFLLLVPVAIWLETGRPLLFVQPRVGRGGKVYNLYKWRSMTNGEVTRVGRLIRKTKLDELPQLINVLKGEMSLVGPRPEMPGFVKEFRTANGYYNLRHMVKPGLTGWSQIMFPDARAEDAMTKLSYDLYYVKHFSIVSDMVIMLETFKMIVFRSRLGLGKLRAPSASDEVTLELVRVRTGHEV